MKSAVASNKPAAASRQETTSIVLAGAIALAWCVILGLLSLTSYWQRLETRGFDELTVLTAPNRSSFPITIVGIDEASFKELQVQWPWPRAMHAELVDKLTKAGAAMIVFDVVFSEPSNFGKKDDQRFAEAIKRAGNVVLAANREYGESAGVREWLRIDPLKLFLDAGAQSGLATVEFDPDQVVRAIPESQDALWRIIVRRIMAQHPELPVNLAIKPGAMLRYVGADHTMPYVSYHEVLTPGGDLPADFFKDQVVIVGRDLKASPDAHASQPDLFATPFLSRTHYLVPGAEIHANAIETVLAQDAITPAPSTASLALLALVALVCALLMRRWRPILGAAAGLAVLGLIGGLDWWLFSSLFIWLPVTASIVVVPAMYVSLGGVSFLREQSKRREVTKVFSLYVTPQVVNKLLADPDGLKLGGEKRDVTFMFTDLASFTTLSEQLPAEKVISLLNRHFTPMTNTVLKHDGTVARFIGDAIMAFWGAPLDDDEQALHAVRSAVEMQQGMKKLREEFAAEGSPAIHMRIGVHSGAAIIGNIGSEKRLEYTAIGDDVNLAARLEGINKLYGTGIMLSDATARQVVEEIPLRRVDKVIVKGRSQAVEVFTPCDDTELVRLSEEAIRQFRAKAWEPSEQLWNELLALYPDDKIAKLYLMRIAEYRAEPPDPKWDGAVSLEKM